MKFVETDIADVLILEPSVFGDERGFFMETFRADEFIERTGAKPFVQDNHSKSAQYILRGLHYQTEQTQGKLVRVTAGKVIDVAVDMRSSSPTFGKSVAAELSAENKRQLWVPEGFAHGFFVLSEFAEFVYKCTNYYDPKSEVSVLWNDSELGIDWQVPAGVSPKLSAKDEAGVNFADAPKFS